MSNIKFWYRYKKYCAEKSVNGRLLFRKSLNLYIMSNGIWSLHLVEINKMIISSEATLHGALTARHYAYESCIGIISFIPMNKLRRFPFNNEKTETQKDKARYRAKNKTRIVLKPVLLILPLHCLHYVVV